MKTYYFNYEFLVPSMATMEVEADTLEEALELARDLDTNNDAEWKLDFESSTHTRLHSIDDEDHELVARISVPESLELWSWPEIDLISQLDKATRVEVDQEAADDFDKAVHEYCLGLPPLAEGEARALLEARLLRQQTGAAAGTAHPIRK